MLYVSEVKVRLYVKYMVSLRCILKVKEELKRLNICYVAVDLGVIQVLQEISPEKREQLRINLLKSGLELLDDNKSILIERIKNIIVEMIHYSDELPKVKYSEYLSEKLGYNYNYLSNVFSEVKGITLQHYIIIHRIEKVKELLLYDEINLTEIAYRLQYSSVAHLSQQFKKITGLTPSFYRKIKFTRDGGLENL